MSGARANPRKFKPPFLKGAKKSVSYWKDRFGKWAADQKRRPNAPKPEQKDGPGNGHDPDTGGLAAELPRKPKDPNLSGGAAARLEFGSD
ncbi:hypothetical protein INR77_13295 [Erythrobacter sp. SCSIO 43205]|uniref:hypothetical protein n=1 Tax=Erythrobacter sp. SCSIO 43205 TaxID=2779361 RepID=UPI001CA9C5A1|nr:hypothetical protein [Erythrobacter sp. SCSIO 43205]UAB77741.1 hypothetical protein INR77_13295 [Erythrobacter sp. SCSIO 43205]